MHGHGKNTKLLKCRKCSMLLHMISIIVFSPDFRGVGGEIISNTIHEYSKSDLNKNFIGRRSMFFTLIS